MTRVLYVSQTGMTEPLGRSQVLTYVLGLTQRGYEFDIVCTEPEGTPSDQIEAVGNLLAEHRVGYYWNRRSRSHALGTKLFESGVALGTILRVARTRRPRIIHARSYMPAAVARVATSVTPGARLLFDVRGLLGEEYVDAGYWTTSTFQYRLLKLVERQLFASAHGVVVLTERHRRYLQEDSGLLSKTTPLEVIPCCVDTARFHRDSAARHRIRRQLGVEDRFVLAYSGTLGAWYHEGAMAQLFARVRELRPSSFLIITRSPPDGLISALRDARVPPSEVIVRSASPGEMPELLSAADAAVSFIEPCFSKLGSSPTKVAEYLAMGLPCALNRGIGDSDDLIQGSAAVVDAGSLSSDDLDGAARRLTTMSPEIGSAARQAALDYFSVEGIGLARYENLYRKLI